MTRIAFAACAKFQSDATQQVWSDIAKQQPDHLILLGDQIYMDYWGDANPQPRPDGLQGYGLGAPAGIPTPEFEAQMQLRYRLQFGVETFRALVHAVGRRNGTVDMVWDDHDFGFNNACGRPGHPGSDDRYVMPPDKWQVSRRLFEEFRRNVQALRTDASAGFQTLPLDWAPAPDVQTVHKHHRLGPADVFMLDTRGHRQPPAPHNHATGSSILGQDQWDWLVKCLQASDAPLGIIASGSTFSSSGALSDQSWKQGRDPSVQPYREYRQLLELAERLRPHKRLVFIGGDRHAVDVLDDHPALPELVCAGSAAPALFGSGRHFCLMELNEQAHGRARLFTRGKEALAWSTVSASAARPAAAQPPAQALQPSALFLATDRKMVGNTPTDQVGGQLSYYRYQGELQSEMAAQLKHWNPDETDAPFWQAVERHMLALRQRHPLHPRQICLFVAGNRETNDEVIEKLRVLTHIAYDANSDGCLGCAIAFDWATEWRIVTSSAIYGENRGRVDAAARHLAALLRTAQGVARKTGAEVSVVAQSLGNRVVLQALTELGTGSVHRWYANAADLEQNVFYTAEGRSALRACRSVLVPYTHSDEVLFLLECVSDYPGRRLGRWGAPEGAAPLPNLHLRDVTPLVSRLTAHASLWMHPWPAAETSGPLHTAFANAMALGAWV